MKTWTRDEETPGLPEGYRREDGWRLRYDGLTAPHGWVVSCESELLPPLDARNPELGPDEAERAQEWADSVIGFGQDWAGDAVDDDSEREIRIM